MGDAQRALPGSLLDTFIANRLRAEQSLQQDQ